jgi:hypothetical protein
MRVQLVNARGFQCPGSVDLSASRRRKQSTCESRRSIQSNCIARDGIESRTQACIESRERHLAQREIVPRRVTEGAAHLLRRRAEKRVRSEVAVAEALDERACAHQSGSASTLRTMSSFETKTGCSSPRS